MISEMVNGMLHRKDGKKVPLGIIPSGTGNSMARYLLRAIEFNPLEIYMKISPMLQL